MNKFLCQHHFGEIDILQSTIINLKENPNRDGDSRGPGRAEDPVLISEYL